MRDVSSTVLGYLGARILKRRNFIWLTGFDLITGAPHSVGFMDDVGVWSVEYTDINTGTTATRTYVGLGSLSKITDIPLVSDVTIRTVTASMSQVEQTVANLIRGYDMRDGPAEIHRGIFVPGTYQLVAPLVPRFVGFIDKCDIKDPKEGNDGEITLSLVSHTRDLIKTNSDVCSDASQKLRHADDSFYKDMGVVGSWMIWWGQQKSTVSAISNSNNSDTNQ